MIVVVEQGRDCDDSDILIHAGYECLWTFGEHSVLPVLRSPNSDPRILAHHAGGSRAGLILELQRAGIWVYLKGTNGFSV